MYGNEEKDNKLIFSFRKNQKAHAKANGICFLCHRCTEILIFHRVQPVSTTALEWFALLSVLSK